MQINDPSFGIMEYDFQWEKQDKFIFGNKEYLVSIVAQSRTDDEKEISQIQRDAYNFYKTHFESMESSCLDCLVTYCREVLEISDCPDSKGITEYITPTTLFFALGGKWGILFESDYDPEDGIAAMYSNGEWEAGKQDILI